MFAIYTALHVHIYIWIYFGILLAIFFISADIVALSLNCYYYCCCCWCWWWLLVSFLRIHSLILLCNWEWSRPTMQQKMHELFITTFTKQECCKFNRNSIALQCKRPNANFICHHLHRRRRLLLSFARFFLHVKCNVHLMSSFLASLY